MSQQTSTQPEQAPVHPRGYKMADEEMERLKKKSESDDVLDPIALHDPVGISVEKVIGRALIVVVLVLVVGILFAQVACKNIQLWGIPSFVSGVTSSSVEKAMESGVSWAGEIVRFPEATSCEYDEANATVRVVVENTTHRSVAALVDASQSQAFALAMSLFTSKDVNRVEYVTTAPLVGDVRAVEANSPSEEQATTITYIWERSDDGSLSCQIEGFDPLVKTPSGQE